MIFFNDCIDSLSILLWKIAFEGIYIREYASRDDESYQAGAL
jgi:hypothetical protein